jgi:hypothetical protein
MTIPNDPWEYYLSFQDKYSVHTNWHRQHLTENLLDMDGFFSSISSNLEEEKLEENCSSIPLGFFQVEQPSRIRYSYIIFSFTILERRMRALLKIISDLKPNLTNDISDYKGSFLERTKSFLKDSIEVDLSSGKMWQDIITLQKIRDCIIHCGGNINESRDIDFLQKLVDSNKIDINKYNYILLTDQYCHDLANSMKLFIEKGLSDLYLELIELERKNSH